MSKGRNLTGKNLLGAWKGHIMAVCSSVVRYKTVGQCASGLLLAVLVLPGVLPTLLRTQTLRRSEE